mgnify:FL=1
MAESGLSSTKALSIVYVSNDDKCLWLLETNSNVMVNGRTAYHRLMVIHVLRDQTECEYMEDLGDADWYNGAGFVIPGLGIELVGNLIDIAESQRDRKPFHVRYGVEMPKVSQTYRETKEEVWRRAKGISVFGPYFNKQRSGT